MTYKHFLKSSFRTVSRLLSAVLTTGCGDEASILLTLKIDTTYLDSTYYDSTGSTSIRSQQDGCISMITCKGSTSFPVPCLCSISAITR